MMLPKLGGVCVLRTVKDSPLSSLSQTNEAKLIGERAATYQEKSALDLNGGSDALIKLVQALAGRGLD
jgi:hypothetical protein